jgi:negative regulator of flagellin synthesis FlgM
MKITHNKVGQNLNLTDSTKADKADGIKNKATGAIDKVDVLSSSSLGESTRVEVSPRAQEAKRIKELAMAAPDVDEAKVEKFRKLIDEGKYNIDAKAIADKMVDEHLDL